MGLKAGIDLGTTNSCIYVLVNDKWELVKDKYGRGTVPSAVWKHEGKLLVGSLARTKVGQTPPPILEIKRLMGTDGMVELDGERKSAIDVSAIILRYLKDQAETFVRDTYPDLAAPITDVVITHPAYFTAAARTATEVAGRQAGFTKVELLPEPIAAALAYAYRADTASDQKILAYDLGGGTFDVTVIERRAADAVVDVLDYGGDHNLGGADFDKCLAQHLQAHLVKKGYAMADLDDQKPTDRIRIQQLKSTAEDIKFELTSKEALDLSKPRLMQDKNDESIDLEIAISREEFNGLTRHLMNRTMRHTHRILAKQSFGDGQRRTDDELDALVVEAKKQARQMKGTDLSDDEEYAAELAALTPYSLPNAQFCDVILVGSSCWMPVVEERVQQELSRPCRKKNLDVIVAEGAAIKAAASDYTEGPIPTNGGRITVFLSYPRVTDRKLKVPIFVEIKGDTSGCKATLCDMETGREEEQRVEKRSRILFQRDLKESSTNEFSLILTNVAEEEILEHKFTIQHDPHFGLPDSGPVTLAIPIKVQTLRDFATLFEVKAVLPVKAEVKFRTPDDSGAFKVPFYEGDTYLDEIRVSNAPRLQGVPLIVKAEMDKNYKVTASVTLKQHAGEQPPAINFNIPNRRLRSLDEIQIDLDELKERFDERLISVQGENKKFDLMSRRREIEREIERERTTITPDRGHVEDLAARFRKLVEEVGMVRELKPSYDQLQEEMDKKRPYAPGAAKVSELNDLLEKARKAWDKQDEDDWNPKVKQCREHTRNWKPKLPPGHPPPEVIQTYDLSRLEEIRKEVEGWPEHAAEARDRLLDDIGKAEKCLQSAQGAEIYNVHNKQVLPIERRVQDGPPAPRSGEVQPVEDY